MVNIVGCLDTPSKGDVFLKGQNVSKLSESNLSTLRGKSVGFVFQQYNLISSMTAYDNVKLPLELQEVPDSIANKRVTEVMAMVSLQDKMKHYPKQLSGGQQQRVSIARCLAANPEILLADEPPGALDSKTGRDVLDILKKLHEKEGKTVIMITHDLHLAQEYASKIVELKDGQIIRIIDNKNKKTKLSITE